jgi:Tol biopolymer transport system component
MRHLVVCCAVALVCAPALAAQQGEAPTLAFLGQREGRVEVYSWAVGASAPRKLSDTGATWGDCLRWSPDGRRLCAILYREFLDLWVIDFDSGSGRNLNPPGVDTNEPCWDEDGATLYYLAGVTWPGGSPARREAAATRAEGLSFQRIYRVSADGDATTAITAPGRYFDLAPAPGGGVIFGEDLGNCRSRLVQVDREGKEVRRWEPGNGEWLGAPAAFGKALAAERLVGWESDVVVFSDATSQIAANGKLTWFPTWSPDGKQLLAETFDNGRRAILLLDADEAKARLWRGPARDENQWYPQWSSDGKLVAYTGDRGGKWSVHVATREGREVAALPPTFERAYGGVFRPVGGEK